MRDLVCDVRRAGRARKPVETVLTMLCLWLTVATAWADGYVIMAPGFDSAGADSHGFRVVHRFNGPANEEPLKDGLGMDFGSRVRLQWDWAPVDGRQISLSRISPTGLVELTWREDWWQPAAGDWLLLTVLGGNIETGRPESRTGQGNSVNLDMLAGYRADGLDILAGVRSASRTNPGYVGESDGSLGLQLAVAYRWSFFQSLAFELLQPVAGFRGSNRNPRMVAAWSYNTGYHQFRLTLANYRELNSRNALAPLTMQDSRDAYLGFVISRRF